MGNVQEKLSSAVTAGNADEVRRALAEGADPHHEFQLVSRAVSLGHAAVVKVLAESNAFDRAELSAALQEVRISETEDDVATAHEIISALAANGADVNATACTHGSWSDITPLMRALGERNDAKVKLLIKCGADPLLSTTTARVNMRDGLNWDTSREEFVREIVHKPRSPLAFAFEHFDVDINPSAEVVALLLSFNPAEKDVLDALELACAARAEISAEVAGLLLQHAKPTAHHLFLSIENGQPSLCAAIMNSKAVDANSHREGLRKEVPLSCAMRATRHRLDICRVLLSHGANPDVFVSEAWTPDGQPVGAHATPVLYVAAADGDFELAAELVDAGANVQALPACHEEGNILHHAMTFGRRFSEPLVALLLRHGAVASLTDGDGLTPLCVLLQRCEKEKREALAADGSKTVVGQIGWELFEATGDTKVDANSLELIRSLDKSLRWAELFSAYM